jgi:hypothetical protein
MFLFTIGSPPLTSGQSTSPRLYPFDFLPINFHPKKILQFTFIKTLRSVATPTSGDQSLQIPLPQRWISQPPLRWARLRSISSDSTPKESECYRGSLLL